MPACLLCLTFAIGIVLFDSLDIQLEYYQIIILYTTIIFTSLSCLFIYKYKFSCLVLIPIIMTLGLLRSHQNVSLAKDHYSLTQTEGCFSGRILDIKEKQSHLELKLKVDSVGDFLKIKSSGKLLIYWRTNQKYIPVGSRVVFKTNLLGFKENPNPSAFNYKRFLERQGIYHYTYLDQEELQLYDSEPLIFSGLFIAIKNRIEFLIENHVKRQDAISILKALLVGKKSQYLDQLKKPYITSGTVHVLAISGLHVGCIAGLFLFLLSKFKQSYILLKLFITASALLSVWTFALISGFSPSVIRASSMFSILILSNLTKKKTSVMNVLFVTAFIMLYTDPNMLFSISFQLSFLAVLSILLFQQSVRDLLPSYNSRIDVILDLFAVSLSAQILISPISVFYFNQLSIIGIFLSVLIVPLTAIILKTSILGLMFSFADFLTGTIFYLAEQLVVTQNTLVQYAAKLEYACAENLHLTRAELVFCFLIITGFYLAKPRLAPIIISSLIILNIIATRCLLNQLIKPSSPEVIAYKISNKIAQDLVTKDKLFSIWSEDIETKDYEFNIRKNQLSYDYSDHYIIPLSLLSEQDITFEWAKTKVLISTNPERNTQDYYNYVWDLSKSLINSKKKQSDFNSYSNIKQQSKLK